MTKRIILAILIISFARQSLFTQQNYPKKYNLQNCVSAAIKKSYSIKAAEEFYKSSEAKLEETKSQNYPELSLNFSYIRIGEVSEFEIPMGPGGTKQKFSFGTRNRIAGEAKAQYQLYTFNRVGKTIELAKKNVEISSLEAKIEKYSVIGSAIQAYFDAYFAKRVIEIFEEQLKRAEKNLEITRAQYEGGKLSELDLKRAESRVQTVKIQLEDAISTYKKNKISLGKIIGENPDAFELEQEESDINFNLDYRGSIEFIEKKYSGFLKINKQKEILDIQKDIAKLSLYPSIFLFANYTVNNGFNPMKPNELYDNWSIGAQFVWKIFDGFASSNSAEAIDYRKKGLEMQKEEIFENLKTTIARSFIQIEQSERNIKLAESNLELAKESYQTALIQYENGLLSQLDLINFEEAIIMSEFSALQARYAKIIAIINVCRIIENYETFVSLEIQEEK